MKITGAVCQLQIQFKLKCILKLLNLGGAVHPLETPLPMLMSNSKALEVILLDLLILFYLPET
jgi:hypothetical protein